jgi:hypothetical protein
MDRKCVLLALGRCVGELQQLQCILADGGYQGLTFAFMPQRWMVERAFVWLRKC